MPIIIVTGMPGVAPSQMLQNKSLHPRARLSSIGYAVQGIRSLVREEPNAKLHAAATVVAVVLGFVRHISRGEWLALLIVIALVWVAEVINTCVEKLCDLWSDGAIHPAVKIIKDMAAAAVLIASLCALAAGAIIFLC